MGSVLHTMSRSLLVPMRDLEYLVRSAPYRYKVFQVPKREPGKVRTIAQPARMIKRLQYWIIANFLKDYPIHPAAMAYRRGKSILHNATPHAKKRYLLKLDFQDFFHSIKAQDFRRLLKSHNPRGFGESDVESLTRILFWKMNRGEELVLSIGAPSSPILSNILLYRFDQKVAEYCKTAGVTYTRYADDLTFSANRANILQEVERKVNELCSNLSYPKLRLNLEKRVHASRATSRRVTGLVLSNEGSVSIGRSRKRQLRAAVHHFKQGKLKVDEATSLSGNLAFAYSVEPKYLQALERKYGKRTINKLMKHNRT